MQNQALVFCNRVVSPLCTSSFCGRRKFLKRALWAEHPSRSFAAHRTSQHCTRCLVATGGSDDEDDEPKQQPTPSTSGRGHRTASSGLGLNPDLEQPVPSEQRPVNELAALRETWLYSWVGCGLLHACKLALCTPSFCVIFSIPTLLRHMLQARLETPSYLSRLGAVWLGFFALVAGPIAFQTFDPSKQVQQQQQHTLLQSMHHLLSAIS